MNPPLRATAAGATPRRILLLKPCCLGDLIQLTAAVSAIHQRWPSASLFAGTATWSMPALAHHPAVSQLYDTGNIGIRGRQGVADLRRVGPVLRGSFDLAIVPDRSPVLALLTWLARIPQRAGYDSGGRGRWYTIRVTPEPRCHELDLAACLLARLGIASLPLPCFYPSAPAIGEAQRWRRTLAADRPLALLAPGGGTNPGTHMPSKRWSGAGYAAVATRLHREGAAVALVGGKSDRAAAAAVHELAPQTQDLTGRTSIDVLGALAGTASVWVGNDAGTTHLAAASGCPTVAIFGPTAPELYAPRGPWIRVITPPSALRQYGDGSVRVPYRFLLPWQDAIALEEVCSAAIEATHAADR